MDAITLYHPAPVARHDWPELSASELAEVTEQINRSVAEEYELFGFDNPPVLSRGVVRTVFRVISQRLITSTPLPPIELESPVDTLASKRSHVRKRAAQVLKGNANPEDFKHDVIKEIRRIQQEYGVSPTMANWNLYRKDTFPSASQVTQRLHMRWVDIIILSGTQTVRDMAEATVEEPTPQVVREEPTPEKPALKAVAESGYEPPRKQRIASDSAEERSETLWRVIGELRMMSTDGTIPTREQWDKEKPADLPTSEAIMARYEFMDWDQVAEYADLEPLHRRRAKKR